MVRVGIILMFDNSWLGGAQYYRNLLKAVYSVPNREIEFVLFVDSGVDHEKLKEFQHLEIIKTKLLKRFSVPWAFRKIISKLFEVDLCLGRLLQKNKIDLLSHSGWLSKRSKIPTMGWIPDFQHMHLPGFFTMDELKVRDKEFLKLCENCTVVIISSYDALKDLRRFFPKAVSKSFVLQFAVSPHKENENLVTFDELKLRYSFSSPYYLLPNQFWAHKNHKVVIEALSILKKKNVSVTVLATGNTNDYRQPGHFYNLEKLICAEDIANEFKVLGIIPYTDLLALFQYASAIINPSFFEGWSTVVEEAKALRKNVILSDIAIHREQSPEFGTYFNPSDAEELASILSENTTSNNLMLESDIQVAADNFTNYGLTYQILVKRVVKSNKVGINKHTTLN